MRSRAIAIRKDLRLLYFGGVAPLAVGMEPLPGVLGRLGSFGRAGALVDLLCSEKQRRATLSTLARLLLILTFLEDGVRIIVRWESQLHYLVGILKRPWLFAVAKLVVCAAVEIVGSVLVLRPHGIAPRGRTNGAYALLVFLAVAMMVKATNDCAAASSSTETIE